MGILTVPKLDEVGDKPSGFVSLERVYERDENGDAVRLMYAVGHPIPLDEAVRQGQTAGDANMTEPGAAVPEAAAVPKFVYDSPPLYGDDGSQWAVPAVEKKQENGAKQADKPRDKAVRPSRNKGR